MLRWAHQSKRRRWLQELDHAPALQQRTEKLARLGAPSPLPFTGSLLLDRVDQSRGPTLATGASAAAEQGQTIGGIAQDKGPDALAASQGSGRSGIRGDNRPRAW